MLIFSQFAFEVLFFLSVPEEHKTFKLNQLFNFRDEKNLTFGLEW